MPSWRHAVCRGQFRSAKYGFPRSDVLREFAVIRLPDMVIHLRAQNSEETMMSKDGLCAIVTGSASGLGAATAAILAKGGGRIVVNYSSSKSEAERTADLCRTEGAEVVVVQGDVARDEDCKKIVAAAASWGRLDVLVNNAGTTKHVAHADLDGLSAEDFQRIYAVNAIGPFQMIRAARGLLEESADASGRAAAVVNVSSIAGIF